MNYFFADDHYGANSGRHVFELLPEGFRTQTAFTENSWSLLESGEWTKDCGLLVLHMIAGTCGQPMPGKGAEKAVRSYCERGGDLLLLHGSSAAFWHWDWWRSMVGLRWVRPGDPDGAAPSTHPVIPCTVEPARARHPLASALRRIELPTDEVYIELEQVSPITVLMETCVNGRTWPQAYLASTPWGGRIAAFIPGHSPACIQAPGLIDNITAMIQWLKNK